MSESRSQSPNTKTRFDIPGFGLPLNWQPQEAQILSFETFRGHPHRLDNPIEYTARLPDFHKEGAHVSLFKSYVDSAAQPAMKLKTLREIMMMQIMNNITEKNDWQTKVFDDSICAKWRAEIRGSKKAPVTVDEDVQEAEEDKDKRKVDCSDRMFEWCIAELRYNAKHPRENGAINAFDFGIIKSDTAIPEALRLSLIAAVALLEAVSDTEKDWHPGSNNQVLDLVHPSLFPLVYGRSMILPDRTVGLHDCISVSGAGVTITEPPESESFGPTTETEEWDVGRNLFSRKFQWLPCEIDVSSNDVKITSYINNLHPSNTELYGIIEQVIKHTIPIWNTTLSELMMLDPNRVHLYQARIDYEKQEYVNDIAEPEQETDEADSAYYKRLNKWGNRDVIVLQPEPGNFCSDFRTRPYHRRPLNYVGFYDKEGMDLPTGTAIDIDLMADYAHRGLQIIVKLANIQLTPDKPGYEGGTWHVEGQLNEHICASAIFYYDEDNISENTLSFRQQCDPADMDNFPYKQWEHAFLDQIYGCGNDKRALQDLGSVVTKQGRLLVFPNVFQHRVGKFELEDKTKPGHRKILALFLVDPHIRIISTANVPCQRRDWWADDIANTFEQNRMSRLPVELRQDILDQVEDFPISMNDAKALRLELMDERKAFVEAHEKTGSYWEFNLCEH